MPSCFDVALKVQKFSSYWSGFVFWQFCSLVNFQLIHFRSELEHFTLAHICRKHLDISTQSCSIHRGFFKKKKQKKNLNVAQAVQSGLLGHLSNVHFSGKKAWNRFELNVRLQTTRSQCPLLTGHCSAPAHREPALLATRTVFSSERK